MKSDMKDRSAAFIASAAISVFLTGLIIIAHDISGELRLSLAGLTGHHWTSVSLISLALFGLVSMILHILSGSKEARTTLKADDLQAWSIALMAITLAMVLGSLIVYIYHYVAV
jgi:hypothetical protein